MNIFVTDRDPYLAAQALDNRRLVKMVLETAQILSTVMWDTDDWGPYRPTHRNHPCTRWAGESLSNYAWLLEHFAALCTEYTHRYGRVHASTKLYPIFSRYLDDRDTDTYWTDVHEFTFHDGSREHIIPRYRAYMARKWRADGDAAQWKNREQPTWRPYYDERILHDAT